MDFEYRYSSEQEVFRTEVRDWLNENVPEGITNPLDNAHTDRETFLWIKDFRKQLGAKGWLYPTWPTEYGGGGLTGDHDIIIKEELEKADVPGTDASALFPAAAAVWGTEDQKQQFLRPTLQGEIALWQLFTEPGAGSDLASLRTRATKDGDDWLINGEKVFNGSKFGYKLGDDDNGDVHEEFDEMFTLAITDPDAPRHRNMGYFIIPGDAPGVTTQTMDLLSGQGKQQIYLDNVRVGNDRLFGGETQGWQVAQTTLELEHGGGGQLVPRNHAVEQMLQLARDTGAGQHPHLVHTLMDAYIDNQILRLIGLRNYWMYEAKQEMSYHGSQNSLWRKESALRTADAIREVLGLTPLLNQDDPKAPFGGALETHQRESLVGAHPGGTIEVQKVIIARRIGVSRTRERAAPTPSTAKS